MNELLSDTTGIDIEKIDNEITDELKVNVTLAIKTELLKKLVGKVERSVAKKAVQDIFKFIYICIEPKKLTFRAINNDFMVEAIANQNEDQTNFKMIAGSPGEICFPADKLVPIVKRLSSEDSSITITANVAVFKSGRPKFDLNGIDGFEFPHTPDLGTKLTSISIHPDILSMMYDRTLYTVSPKESRPVLTGVHHKLNGNQLCCVATDSHRLAQYTYDLDESYPDVKVTIPGAVLSEVKKHLDTTEKEVTIHFYNNQAVYEYEDVTLYGRILDGNYPNTNALIFSSGQAGSSFVVHANSFKNLLNNSTVYNPDQPIVIRVKPELNQLRVNTHEAEIGAFQEDLAITEGIGEDLILGVNVRYLQEAFARYGNDDYVQFHFLPSIKDQPAEGDKPAIAGKPAGTQPFKCHLFRGNENCLELFVPVRTSQIKYKEEVVIDDFQGIPEFNFNPFEADFQEVE